MYVPRVVPCVVKRVPRSLESVTHSPASTTGSACCRPYAYCACSERYCTPASVRRCGDSSIVADCWMPCAWNRRRSSTFKAKPELDVSPPVRSQSSSADDSIVRVVSHVVGIDVHVAHTYELPYSLASDGSPDA